MNCPLCSEKVKVQTPLMAVVNPVTEVKQFVCLKCYNAINQTDWNVRELERQIAYNEKYDRCLNSIVPLKDRGAPIQSTIHGKRTVTYVVK